MAISNGQRVAAFLLALLFLGTTVGTTAYVIWQINRDGLVSETADEKAAADKLAQERKAQEDSNAGEPCGSKTYPAVDPRPVPTTLTSAAVTELQKTDVKVGDGEEVQSGDCVAALYYGTLAKDGTKFDGNYESGNPIEFSLSGVIQGWTEGIPGMKVGGIRRLVIPAAQAYGSQERSGIPANSDLVFEVEIVGTRRNN